MRTLKQAKKKSGLDRVYILGADDDAFEDNIMRMKAIIEQLFSSGAVYYYIIIQGGTSFQV